MKENVLALLKERRSIYALGKDIPQSDDEIITAVQNVIRDSPTAFNSQTVRTVFLFGDKHDQLWDIVVKRLESEVPTAAAYEATKKRIAGFKAAHGTIMFYTDHDVVTKLKNDFPLYADNFESWAEQAQGSAQLNTWVTLADNQIGANLQHYNPIIDDLVREAFPTPENWILRAQMPYGAIQAPAQPKDYIDIKEQFMTFGH